MNLDTFLKSQTFKTGMFVLVVLFILMLVFKLGVLHGYKKAIFPHAYGVNKHRNVEKIYFGQHTGAFKKDTYANYTATIEFLKAKKLSAIKERGSEADKELDAE